MVPGLGVVVMALGIVAMALGALMATPVSAGTGIDAGIVDALDREGRYLESSDAAVEAAVDSANQNGIAFVSLNQGGDITTAENLADQYVLALEQVNSPYHTVLVLTLDAYAAFSTAYSDAEVEQALEASFQSFSSGSASRGVDSFTASLQGAVLADSGTSPTTTPAQADSGSSEGGIGFGTILTVVAVLGGGFLLLRSWRGNRRAKEQAAVDLEEDRIEIEEQLKNNADRVISLGDQVIASGDTGLIDLYEEASQTYQDVSHLIDETETAAGIDELDDRIDKAEWQFEVIEARLAGRPAPPEPQYGDPIGPEDKPASGPLPPPPAAADQRGQQDRSVITSPTTGREYRRPSGTQAPTRTQRRTPTRRRSGGLGGGGLGGILGGVLGNIILGGGLGGGSRRTQRRTGGLGMPSLGGSQRRTTGGLGGGVLRRGGNSAPRRSNTRARTRPQRRSSSTRGGGRSLGNRRGGGRSL